MHRTRTTNQFRCWLLVAVCLVITLTLICGCSDNASSRGRTSPGSTYLLEGKLQRAACEGNVNVVQDCVNGGIDVNGENASSHGFPTPLVCAVRGGYTDIAQILLNAGADPDIPSAFHGGNPDNKLTPLMYAAAMCDVGFVHLLIDRQADIDATGHNGSTALLFAVKENCTDCVRTLIDRRGNVNTIDSFGQTALMLASGNCNSEIVRLLLLGGAVVDAADDEGVTSLMRAAAANCSQCVRELVAAGADVQVRASDKWSGLNALEFAFIKGDVATFEALIDGGAELPSGGTLLHLAAAIQRIDLVHALINRGDDVNARDLHGRTPLHSNQVGVVIKLPDKLSGVDSSIQDDEAIITAALLEAGADVNALDAHGQTPLHMASLTFEENRIKLLLLAGADPNIKDSTGLTPLELFREFKRQLTATKHNGSDLPAVAELDRNRFLSESANPVQSLRELDSYRSGLLIKHPNVRVQMIATRSSGDSAALVNGKLCSVGDKLLIGGKYWLITSIESDSKSVTLTELLSKEVMEAFVEARRP